MTHPLLIDIDSLDFNNVREISDYAMLLIKDSGEANLHPDNPQYSPTRTIHRKLAKQWIESVSRIIDSLPANDALSILDNYAMMHNIAYQAVVDSKFIERYITKALDCRIHGDNSIDVYGLYEWISCELRGTNRKAYLEKPLEWHAIMIKEWYDEFRNGRYKNPRKYLKATYRPAKPSVSDILNRVSILLHDNLWGFEPNYESEFKQKLFINHRHYLDELPKDDSTDYNTLIALNRVLFSSLPYMDYTEFETYKTSIDIRLFMAASNPYARARLEIKERIA